jgi:hypothetical protein
VTPLSWPTYPPAIQSELFYTDVERHSAHDHKRRAPFQSPPTPEPPDAPPGRVLQTHGWVGAGLSITEPFDVNGRKMNSWYAKLPDWQMALTWLVVTAVAGVIYFVP